MYKLLITTWLHKSDSFLRTDIVSYDTEKDANDAHVAIETSDRSPALTYHQRSTRLYKVSP